MSTVPQLTVLGDGAFAGAATNIADYSVSEYASPVSMTDLQGGVSGVSFDVIEDPGFNGSMLLPNQLVELYDPYAGYQRAVIDNISSSDETLLNIQAGGMLMPLVSVKSAAAFSGTLGAAIMYYCSLCGVTDGFQMDTTITNTAVNLPSWNGEVWTQLKKLQAIYQFEMAEVGERIIVRALRLRQLDIQRYGSSRLTYGNSQASQIVEVYYYNNAWKTNAQVYPDPASFITDREIISVDAGETKVQNVEANMWISSISPPEMVGYLPWTNTSTSSVYAVVDKDGRPVNPNDWRNGGGKVTFAIGADRKSIDVTVQGMITNSRAPYRLASSSTDREYQYPALYINATGIAFKKELMWAPTGASLEDAPADSVITIDDPMVSNKNDAVRVLANAVMRSSGFSQVLEVTTTSVNRRGKVGTILYPTFDEFDQDHPAETFTAFNASLGTKTFKQFTAEQGNASKLDFANQSFGGVGGSRVRHRDAWYRVVSSTTRHGEYQWTAEPDTLFSDWSRSVGQTDITFATFNSKWNNKTFEQHARMPLYN